MKYLFIILFTLTFARTSGQTSGSLYYSLKKNDGASPTEIILNYKILFDGQRSLELTLPKKDFKVDDKLTATGENEFSKKVIIPNLDNSISFVFKDYQNNQLLYTDNISIRYYFITDTLENYQWTITKEKSKIQDYDCIKATTSFRGRTYNAWFAEKIPIRFGPWKFGGLPGLIIKVEDLEQKYVFELTGLDLTTKIISEQVSLPEQYLSQTPQTYMAFRETLAKKLSDYEKQSNVVTFQNNGSTRTQIKLPPKIEKY